MSKRLLTLAIVLIAATQIAKAQQITAGIDFKTFFNNKEYADTEVDGSGTDFAARLTPQLGVRWADKNSLVFAVDLLQEFGAQTKFLTEAKPLFYYQYESPKVKAVAGIFPRSMLMGHYSSAIYSTSTRFYDNRFNGFLAHYVSGKSFVEFAINWEGMYSAESREKFRILSAGRQNFRHFYYGYDLSMFHFAKSANEELEQGVVDNILVNPLVGVKFNAFFDFDIQLGYLQTMQRNRKYDEGWRTPKAGELLISMSRWGLTLRNSLYVLDNLQPFYAEYGKELYQGTGFYRTTGGIYNKTVINYKRSFFDDTLGVKAEFAAHYDGTGLGLQQIVEISVKLRTTAYDIGKHKK